MSDIQKNRNAVNDIAKKLASYEKLFKVEMKDVKNRLENLEVRIDDVTVDNIEAIDDSIIRKVG